LRLAAWAAGLVLAALGAALLLPVPLSQAQTPAPDAQDPYRSLAWPDLRAAYLDAAPLRFDGRVQVLGPAFAEDPMNVPIRVQVDPSLGAVERVVVLVDRNPIQRVLEFRPGAALPAIGFRFKLEQASPVRAAAKLADGRWVVGGTWVDAAGGGCTVAGASRQDGSWSRTLGQVHGRLFSRAGEGAARLRLQVMHPMDTGLAAGIPAFYVQQLAVQDAQGRELARLATYEPVSENPVFSLDFAQPPAGGLQIVGADNNGNRIASRLP